VLQGKTLANLKRLVVKVCTTRDSLFPLLFSLGKTQQQPVKSKYLASTSRASMIDDPTTEDDLRETLAAHEIEIAEEWADVE